MTIYPQYLTSSIKVHLTSSQVSVMFLVNWWSNARIAVFNSGIKVAQIWFSVGIRCKYILNSCLNNLNQNSFLKMLRGNCNYSILIFLIKSASSVSPLWTSSTQSTNLTFKVANLTLNLCCIEIDVLFLLLDKQQSIYDSHMITNNQ